METIIIESIGKVHLRWGARFRSIKIKVSPRHGLELTFPNENYKQRALQHLYEHKDWAIQQLAKAKTQYEKQYLFKTDEPIKTKYRTVYIRQHEQDKIRLEAQSTQAIIYIPSAIKIHSQTAQTYIRRYFEEILKNESEFFVLPLAKKIAQEKNIPVKRFQTRASRSRWGSCSSENVITLSSYLVLLPEKYIEYVICHELAHVKEKNHQDSFWQHLQSLLPNALQLDTEMRKYRTTFMPVSGDF